MMLTIGPLTISYYAVSILTGISLGYWLVVKRKDRYKINIDDIETLSIIVIPASIIGARLYHIIAEWWYYKNHLYEILTFRMNGLGLFGVIISAAVSYTHLRAHET